MSEEITITPRPERHEVHVDARLRLVLKKFLRRWGLRCVDIRTRPTHRTSTVIPCTPTRVKRRRTAEVCDG